MAPVFDGDGWLQSDRLSRKERQRRRERKEVAVAWGLGLLFKKNNFFHFIINGLEICEIITFHP